MKKKQYLKQPEVTTFSTWFAKALQNKKITHRYSVPGSKLVTFDGLEDALRKYEWPFRVILPNGSSIQGASYSKNTAALDRLSSGLNSALNGGLDGDVRDWCISVMEWGGVRNGNVRWLNANAAGLATTIRAAQKALASGDDQKRVLRKAVKRFNAGMTKVYSLVVPEFVIYDSRVAAALTWFIAKWCHETGKAQVPALLKFPCMRPKEGDNPTVRKSRNPSCGGLVFPWMSGATAHAHWNLRASWLLADALGRSGGSYFHKDKNPLRGLEAALFMWGYDLSQNSACTGAAEDIDASVTLTADALEQPELVESHWRDGTTRGGKAKKFRWRCDRIVDAIIVERARGGTEIYPAGELFRVIHELYDRFGYDWFPLENSVTKLKDGTVREGLGRLLLRSHEGRESAKIAHAQGASQLGVVLEELGILEWNRATRGIHWRIRIEPPETIEELRATTDLAA